MDDTSNLFPPSLAAAVRKLDPDDSEQILEYFKTHALLSREKALLQASVREQKKLLVENGKLKKDIEQLKVQLQDKKGRRTAKALLSPAPPPPTVNTAPATPVNQLSPAAGATAAARAPHSSTSQGRRRRGERKAGPTTVALSLGAEPRIDVSRLDLRVGRILGVRRHPLVESMSVQEVDVGENAPRMVVSKLSEKTQLEEGGFAVLLCNVKACKLKGVVSQARILCCSTSDDCIELLAPPTGSAPGDRVTFLNHPGEPDRELQSKQRVWERVQPDLQVDCRGVANYKGCGFEVKGKGLCRAPTLVNCTIK
ncbi:aminoacyl tRNA synthase complex-interacting multifunctional protein 1-like [Solea senegalensis]|uniref:Aminoacyl tRNA synthase complex-interacting multifunctional protein 1-like n=1 Tax=Solea senegalensis TaxID=28829 RepID=A0AAV6QS95_SOLSE|nr:aminoacyl tRNA synthase complex-interacting multifunctional protein 1-like isoform X1 [Solea senegalensis]KAG7495625.1 aminoacyl tRNA synthase complex-interacting multifunctional protein 1-like [Solea senegalensis]